VSATQVSSGQLGEKRFSLCQYPANDKAGKTL